MGELQELIDKVKDWAEVADDKHFSLFSLSLYIYIYIYIYR